jgi:hypothetical protein
MKTALALAFTVTGCASRSSSPAAVYGGPLSRGIRPITLEPTAVVLPLER